MNYLKHLVLCTLLLGLAMPSMDPVQAQEQHWKICIMQVSTQEQPNEMIAKIYVTICDPRTGVPMSDPDVQSVQVVVSGYTSEGELKKPDVPIYIVDVLDSSRSMAGAAPALIRAAKQSLNNAPENSKFSIVQFDQGIRLLQDFTENIPTLTYAIDQYQVSQNGTCLFDAAYSAVEAITKAPAGRRAVILFTDGKDETKEGKPCSKHTFNQLVEFASKSQVPISTIGLSYERDALNELELKALADATGGISAMASEGNLDSAFENIMLALKAQKMIKVPIYPHKGMNNAVLSITLKDGTTFEVEFPVTSNTDYAGPVHGNLVGLVLNPEKQMYEAQLNMTAPELVEYIRIEVTDLETGSKVEDYHYKGQLSTSNSLNLPTAHLTIGRAYSLKMLAISKEDQRPFLWVQDSNGKLSSELVYEFRFDPCVAGVYPSLQMQSVGQIKYDLVLSGTVPTNADLVGSFDGWLEDDTTKMQVRNSKFDAQAFSNSTGTITIPAKTSQAKDGKYSVVVQVLAKNNNVYCTIKSEPVFYDAPSSLERLGLKLLDSPIFSFSIFGIILAATFFFTSKVLRQKSPSGTPIFQKFMEGNLVNQKSWTQVIPAEGDEPMAFRNRSSDNSSVHVIDRANNPGSPQSANATGISPIRRATLTVLQDGNPTVPQESTVVTPLPFLIGRSEGILNLSDSKVSRNHAQISYDNIQQAYYITDMNSSNGTLVNDERIFPGQPVPLPDGATVRLGPNVTFRFDL